MIRCTCQYCSRLWFGWARLCTWNHVTAHFRHNHLPFHKFKSAPPRFNKHVINVHKCSTQCSIMNTRCHLLVSSYKCCDKCHFWTNISQQSAASIIRRDDETTSSKMSLDGFQSQSGYSKEKYPFHTQGIKCQSTARHYTG